MSFFQFNCAKNDFLEELRLHFNATPLKEPDTLTQPLLLVAHRGSKTQQIGPIQDFLIPRLGVEKVFQVDVQTSPVADKSIRKTNRMSGALAIELLQGVWKAFGAEPAAFSPTLKNALEVSITFQEIIKKQTFPSRIGSELNNYCLDLEHAALHVFFRKKRRMSMFLISSVLQCRKFTLELEKLKNAGLGLDVPTLETLGKGILDVKADSGRQNSISYSGDQYLTFAFSCLELFFEEDTGMFKLGESSIWSKNTANPGAGTGRENKIQEFSILDQRAPALLEWD